MTWHRPEHCLALDEWLVTRVAGGAPEVLWFWEPQTLFVVVGYGNCVRQEVHWEACAADGVPIFRRVSGGGTVLQMPGCLNYSLILRVPQQGPLTTITGANHFIMQRHAAALSRVLGRPVEVKGITDLALAGRKCSGNAQRRYKEVLLFHGVFLLDARVELMERYLRFPSRVPDYRHGRRHADFVANLQVRAEIIKTALRDAWQAASAPPPHCEEELQPYLAKYASPAWNLRH
ncbi:MAG: lipoate--protein ligase family protein [Verrucomicrobiae bacterium]|nr:lipoate--protein ligase family protein [Verrucomicrobiae bacterium]